MNIYKITNKVNGKVYIGCTVKTIEERWLLHYRQRKSNKNIFSKALRKYKKEDFSIELIEQVSSYEEMLKREIFWISYYGSTNINNGYNMLEGGNKPPIFYGENHHMHKKGMSDKQKEIMRAANLGRKQSPEHIEKCRLTRIGKKATPEHIEKCRLAKAGFKHTEESKRKVSKSKMGTISPKRRLVLCLNNYKVYNGHEEAAKKLGLSRSAVTRVSNGTWEATKGYRFQNMTNEHLIF